MRIDQVIMRQAAVAVNWAEAEDIENFIQALDNASKRLLSLALMDAAGGFDIEHIISNMAHPNKIEIHVQLHKEIAVDEEADEIDAAREAAASQADPTPAVGGGEEKGEERDE